MLPLAAFFILVAAGLFILMKKIPIPLPEEKSPKVEEGKDKLLAGHKLYTMNASYD